MVGLFSNNEASLIVGASEKSIHLSEIKRGEVLNFRREGFNIIKN